MYKNILIPVDGSEASLKALITAKSLGEHYGSNLILLAVMSEHLANYYEPYLINAELKEKLITVAEETVGEAKNLLGDYKYNITEITKFGIVDKEIVKAAENYDADLIVMGNRGLGNFSKLLLGSVSNKVINKSPVSVLIVKSDDED